MLRLAHKAADMEAVFYGFALDRHQVAEPPAWLPARGPCTAGPTSLLNRSSLSLHEMAAKAGLLLLVVLPMGKDSAAYTAAWRGAQGPGLSQM